MKLADAFMLRRDGTYRRINMAFRYGRSYAFQFEPQLTLEEFRVWDQELRGDYQFLGSRFDPEEEAAANLREFAAFAPLPRITDAPVANRLPGQRRAGRRLRGRSNNAAATDQEKPNLIDRSEGRLGDGVGVSPGYLFPRQSIYSHHEPPDDLCNGMIYLCAPGVQLRISDAVFQLWNECLAY